MATDQVDLPRSYKFAPEDIVVPAGTTVTWTNNDNFTHSVRLLDSGETQMMKPGESVTHAFTALGAYQYDCSLHPKDMPSYTRLVWCIDGKSKAIDVGWFDAQKYPLDLSPGVLAIGHSSGGSLAGFIAMRHRLGPESELYTPDPLRVAGGISLDGALDMVRRMLLEP